MKLLPLWGIVCLALGLRLMYFTTPLADAHRWRQTDNAAIAYNFAFEHFNLLYPEVNWGGPPPSGVEMEFPLFPALVAIVHLLFGDSHLHGRAVVIAFSLATVIAIYAIGRRLYGDAAARGAALLFAISPTAVYFGRAFIVDTPTVFFSTCAVLGFLTYVQDDDRRAASWGGICLALAWMTKLPALLTLAPVAYLVVRARGRRVLHDRWFLAAVSGAAALTVAWYWHAHTIYLQTGLTVGIWQGAGTYPGALGRVAGPTATFSGWSTADLLAGGRFSRTLIERFWSLHLTPLGAVLSLAGAALAWSRRGSGVVYVWLAAAISFVVVVGEGNLGHEYYQLPVLPPLALLFGVAAAPAFGEDALTQVLQGTRRRRPAVAVLFLCILTLCLWGFRQSGVVQNYFRPDSLDFVPVDAGHAVARATPANAILVVVEHEETVNAANSPMLLYHARRRGWSFDLRSLTPAALAEVERRGAGYFVTTHWTELQQRHPVVATRLNRSIEVPLDNAPADTRLFRLGEPRNLP